MSDNGNYQLSDSQIYASQPQIGQPVPTQPAVSPAQPTPTQGASNVLPGGLTRDQINDAYMTHLGRPADDEAYQAWGNVKTPEELTQDIWNSPEWKARKATADNNAAAAAATAATNMAQYNNSKVPLPTNFNPTAYMQSDPALMQAWQEAGKPPIAQWAAEHFQTVGWQQGRSPTGNLTDINTTMSQNATNPTLPNGTKLDPVLLQTNPDEMVGYHNVQGAQVGTTAQGTASQATGVAGHQAQTYNASTIGNNTPTMDGVHGTVSKDALVQAQQGTLSQGTLDAFNNVPQGDVDPRATVKNQYEQLMDFKPGEEPLWAKGAMRAANSQMAARGMGGSSMAAEAVTAALAQAALPIAQQDASTYAAMGLKNLDIKAQSTLYKAQALAGMDMANLNNRQQAAVINAQSFLQMDFKNMDNEQQARAINQQARLQSLFADQAAENASKQFNAQSQNQMTQFYDSLTQQVNLFNTEQQNAMSKFNAGEQNMTARFNAQLQQQSEMFNAQNQLIVDQSNVQWRRQVNTANTAAQNAANQFNATNLLNISNTALNNMWQQQRDTAYWAWTSGENDKTRAGNVAMASLSQDQWFQRLDAQSQKDFQAAIGSTIADIVKGGVQYYFSDDE